MRNCELPGLDSEKTIVEPDRRMKCRDEPVAKFRHEFRRMAPFKALPKAEQQFDINL
jgi:hypothetical protein